MEHTYHTSIIWTGNLGQGTAHYRGYARTWDITAPGKPTIPCSNDPLLGGDPTKMNPEDLLMSSLSACHMLWYLHLASTAGVTVIGYQDSPTAVGEVLPSGAGRFLSITLNPVITVLPNTDLELAHKLHDDVHPYCFISRSVNFPVTYQPQFIIASETA